MPNYQLGKIYKITGNGYTYYGSTCEPTLARRLSGHVCNHKQKLNNKNRITTSFKCFENDCKDYVITLVELFPCNSKDELHARERYHIENNECINKYIPTRSKQEYRNTDENKEHVKKQTAEYREKNRFLLKEKAIYYRERCKDINKERNKQFDCNCGGRYMYYGKNRHFKSMCHQAFLNSVDPNSITQEG